MTRASRIPSCAFSLFTSLALFGCAKPAPPAAPAALIGPWRGEVQFSDGAFATTKDLQFLYVFNAGGTMTESSNYDGVPPVAPAYGAWRETGANTFEATYTFFTTQPPADVKTLLGGGGWMPAGHGVLSEHIQLAADGRSFDSTIKLELFDKSGKAVEGSGTAKAHAVRAGF